MLNLNETAKDRIVKVLLVGTIILGTSFWFDRNYQTNEGSTKRGKIVAEKGFESWEEYKRFRINPNQEWHSWNNLQAYVARPWSIARSYWYQCSD